MTKKAENKANHKVDLNMFTKPKKKNLLKEPASPKKSTVKKLTKKKTGRPAVTGDQKLSEKITSYFTKSEYAKLEKLSEQNIDAPLSKIVRNALKQAGVI